MNLETFTVEEFQERWDDLLDRVENGESFYILHPNGYKVVITPINETSFIRTSATSTEHTQEEW